MPAELTDANYRTLALAALVQAAQLVHCAANGRPFDAVAREAVLAAVATHRADSLLKRRLFRGSRLLCQNLLVKS